MDIALSDITFSEVGVHVVGSLAAFIAVEACKSLFSANGTRPKQQNNAVEQYTWSGRRLPASKVVQPAEAAQGSWLSRLFSCVFLFFVRFAVKAMLALAAASLAIAWLQGKVNLAVSYRLSAEMAETLHLTLFFLVLVLAWWILPIRLFKR